MTGEQKPKSHCKRGHALTPDNFKIVVVKRHGWIMRERKTCRAEWDKRGHYTAEQIVAVERALDAGKTIAQVTKRDGDRPALIKFVGLATATRDSPRLGKRLRAKSEKNAKKAREQRKQNREWAAHEAARANRQAAKTARREEARKARLERLGVPLTEPLRRLVFPADEFMRLLEQGFTLQQTLTGRGYAGKLERRRCGTKEQYLKYCAMHPETTVFRRTDRSAYKSQ
ncbi:hypothetical protein [Bradyrhizobium viridifuturi]|uniref:hypothetical protein n=1 Tax=Bradyrhizobium viridifuturi TaxID=1654716 RepID=UPI00067EE8AC|nr:hypothetical protein [Bradyrhizobium viridifuturi]